MRCAHGHDYDGVWGGRLNAEQPSGVSGRVLVLGGSGMLGHHVREVWGAAAVDMVIGDIHPQLSDGDVFVDVSSRSSVATIIESSAADVVINLAALTSLEYCESHPEEAYAVNTLGPFYVAEVCSRTGRYLVHLSTAGVFDGAKDTAYVECDPVNPLNVYGKTKLLAELAVEGVLRRNVLIVRTGWMMGGGTKDVKFVGAVLRQLSCGARALMAVGDKVGSPTFAGDLARALLTLTASRETGLRHVASMGVASRYDVLVALLDELELENSVAATEVTSETLQDAFPVLRASNEALETLYALEPVMPHWRLALKRYVRWLERTGFLPTPLDPGAAK